MKGLTSSDIGRMVDSSTYSKGAQCYRSGRVKGVDTSIPGMVWATVEDHLKASRLHSVVVDFVSDGQGAVESFRGECSCPERHDCRHMVAALLSACDLGPNSVQVESRPPPLPPEVHKWLGSAPGTDPGADMTVKSYPEWRPRTRDQLFFVLQADAKPGDEVSLYRGRLRKDGCVGANAKPYHVYNSFTKDWFLTLDDLEILAKLSYYRKEHFSSMHDWPDGVDLIALIRRIVDTGRARGGDIQGPTLFWTDPWQVSVTWSTATDGAQRVIFSDPEGSPVTLLPFPVPLYLDLEHGLIGVAETGLEPATVRWLASAPPTPADAVATVSSYLKQIDRNIPLPVVRNAVVRTERPVPQLTLFGTVPPVSLHRAMQVDIGLYLECISEDRYDPDPKPFSSPFPYPCLRLDFVYPGVPVPVRSNTLRAYRTAAIEDELPDIQVLGDDVVEFFRRDRSREMRHLKRLDRVVQKHCPEELLDGIDYCLGQFDGMGRIDYLFPMFTGPWEIGFSPALDFFVEELPKLRAYGWKVKIEDSWPLRVHEGPVSFSTALEPSDNDWFSLSLQMQVDGHAIDLVPLILDFIKSMTYQNLEEMDDGSDVVEKIREQLAGRLICPRLPNGTIPVLQGERFAPFIAAFLEAQGLVGFHLAETGRAMALAEALEGCGAPWVGGQELRDLGNRLRALNDASEAQPPPGFTGSLRHYQLEGFGWLKALASTGFGGALADDMGLGKTVQALTLLAHRHLEEGTDRPSLLIVPTSLLGNWRREAERFTPGLKLLILHGSNRAERFSTIPEHHLIITTYPLVNRDHGELFNHEYELAILDEAQNVKNPAAATAKRIRGIRSRQRLALTGTPIENSLEELWALYDWLIPGLLGDRKTFGKNFRTPIEKQGDAGCQRLLSTRLKPFLLRRTKEEVAGELPPKTVIDEILPLDPDQGALYESIRAAMDERVRRVIAEKGISGSRITILDALLKLRQVCCDPSLVKLEAARKVQESAKRSRLLQLLEELVAEGRKVLVFSQFVAMLRLIAHDIEARGWDHAMLHGGTKAGCRDAEIRRFQAGEAPIFLVSLKAGGTGLNLTAADTVILYDPWWNPATERQAMDRAHRIGQDKPVFVHRLIAEGTVEMAIQEMQARKQALADALFEGTGEGPMALTEEDLKALFGGG